MIHDIAYYRKIQDAHGAETQKQALVNGLRKRLSRDFKSTINWEPVEINGEQQELLVMKSTSVTIKKIEARPGEILRLGSLIKWHGVYWLVTAVDADDQIQAAGTMTQCNTILRWQTPDLSVAVTYAVTEDATKYGTGVSDNELMRIGEFALKAKVQMNEQTLQIRRDQRFLIGESGNGYSPNAYITSRINLVTGTYVDVVAGETEKNYGYIEITMLEDQFREHCDRADLMIADYIEDNDNAVDAEETQKKDGVFW